MKTPPGLIARLLAVLALYSIIFTQASAHSFTANSPLLTARWSHTATLLTNGLVLIAGGTIKNELPDDPSRATDSCELYDPSLGAFTLTGSLPDAQAGHVAILLTNGLVLVAGGRGDFGGVTARAALYYPASGSWTNTGFLNQSRSAFAAALLRDGRVLVVGGFSDDNGEESSAEIYNPVSKSWTTIAPLNYASDSLTATLLADGRVLVAGGGDGGGGGVTNASIFNPTTQSWTATGPLNTARAGHAAVLLPDGEVLIAGGAFDNSAEIYDPATGKWSYTGNLNEGRLFPSLTLLPEGQVLAVGGSPGQTDTELYDPDTDIWTSDATLNVGRVFHTATLLDQGQVVVTGGDSGVIGFYNGPALADVETYHQINKVYYALNAPNLVWTTGGGADWFLETTNTHDGVSAAQSGAIGDGDQSSVETTVTGPGTLSFWWQVSSETNSDYLEFDVDDNAQDAITGVQTWTHATYDIPAGAHTVKWIYYKDSGGSDGMDAGFLDEVSFIPTPTLTVSALPSSGIVPLTVRFISSGVDGNGNAVTNWNWNFGDGSTSTNQNPSHVFATAGLFNPSLTARGVGSVVPLAITGLGQIIVTNRPFGSSLVIEPQLKIEKVGDQTVLSVFNRFPGSLVESAPDLRTPSPWPQVIPFPDGLGSVILDPTNRADYFRLRGSASFNINSVAPPLDPTAFADVASAAEFIYNGTNGIQTGVASGVIRPDRAAILRGRVLQRDGSPLANARVSVLDHTEFGQTFTRADGRFDLALNGGFDWHLNFEKFGYLPAQRLAVVAVQDYQTLPDVVLIPLDPVVTTVTLGNASPGAIARGSTQTDSDGSRTATLVMPPGLHGSLVLPDGTTQEMTTIHVRATEFTVGANGPAAMPAALPPTSGYTYAVELSADEAFALGANTITFDQDIPFYVENFLGFAVGIHVPSAFYDRQKAAWVPIPDGRVIKITQVANNLAEVDTDGDGQADADHGASIGITAQERGRLATLYAAGQTLWRVPVRHFTPYDHNYSIIPGPGSTPPGQPAPETAKPKLETPDGSGGYGTIEIENQVLTEHVPVVGTHFSLEYSSGEATDDLAAYQMLVHLSGTNVPGTLKGIRLTVGVAGQTFVQNFPAAPNQSYVFTWNGLDVYGRKLPGQQPVGIRIDYTYDAFYQFPGFILTSFGIPSGALMTPTIPARFDIDLSQTFTAKLGSLSRKGLGLGGWDLSVHHMYDPGARVLYMGDGGQRHAESVSFIVKRVAGVLQQFAPVGDGGPALDAKLSYPYATAFGPDGSMYIAEGGGYRVRRVAPDGIISTVAGQGSDFSYGDGGPAVNAGLGFVQDVAVGPDGSVYISDFGNGQPRVRRIDASGIIRTVAGGNAATGDNGPNGDGGPATQAGLPNLNHIMVGPDGTLYIDQGGFSYANKIRRVGPDGTITTFAGQGAPGFSGDGGPAQNALFKGRLDMALGPDGSVYILDSFNGRVRRVTPDGIINTIIGGGSLPIGSEGVQGTNLNLGYLGGIDVGRDGTVYFSCLGTNLGFAFIYRVTPDGIAHLHAGANHFYGSGDPTVDNVPARQAQFDSRDLTVGPDGALYTCDLEGFQQVRRIAPPLPQYDGDPIFIPSSDGSEVYVFDPSGRHISTKNALTGANMLEFHYDSAGRLTSIQDGNGLVTTIQHDGAGNPSGILAPFGQHTTLAADFNGFLAHVSNPAGETTLLGYSGSGLLSSVTGPKGDNYTFGYDGVGHLLSAADSAGGSTTLVKSALPNGYEVQATSALGRVSHHLVETLTNGVQRRLTTYADGTHKELLIGNNDGTRTTLLSSGTMISSVEGPDPRFGMQSPILSLVTVSTPGGLTNTLRTERVANLLNSDDVFSVSSLRDVAILNGRTNSVTYFGSNHIIISTSPEGRSSTNQMDVLGRTVFSQAAGMNPVTFAYDSLGRVTNTVVGSGLSARSLRLGYDSAGRMQSTIDALGREVGFDFDAADRPTQQHLPDGRVIQFGYDLNGRATSLTPPGRPAHQFGNDVVNQLVSYTPPAVNGITNGDTYWFNADRDFTNQIRADGLKMDFSFSAGGQLVQSSFPNSETLTSSYDPSGNLSNISSTDGNSISFARDGSLLTNVIWTGEVTGRVSFAYDQDFRVATQQVNGSAPVQFVYNRDGLVTNVGALRMTYRPENALLSGTSLSAVADTRTHNAFGELTNYTATFSNQVIYSYSLQCDGLGRITNKSETIGGSTSNYAYTYDIASRLSEVRIGGALVASYAYDTNGNRRARTNALVTATYVYDNRDRLIQRTAGAELSQFDYTAEGELRTQTVASAKTVFTYDARGNLRQLVRPDATQIAYVVDGNNRRIGKRINGLLVKGFLYQDALNPVAELDGNNNLISRFVYGARLNVPEYMIRGGITYRFVCDYLGSVRLVVNATNGVVAQRLDYDEFGAVLADTNPGFQPFGFAGGIYDPDTGLVRFGLRDYDASIGRWTRRDPISFAGGDTALFNYVGNNPLNAIDSTGTGPFMQDLRRRALAGDARAMAAYRNLLRSMQNIDTGIGEDAKASADAYGRAARVSQAGILTLSAVSGFSAMAGATSLFADAALAGQTLNAAQIGSGVLGFANGGVVLGGNAANAAINLATPLDKPVASAPASIPQALLPESLAPYGDAALGKVTPEAGGPAWAKTAAQIDDAVTKATSTYNYGTGQK